MSRFIKFDWRLNSQNWNNKVLPLGDKWQWSPLYPKPNQKFLHSFIPLMHIKMQLMLNISIIQNIIQIFFFPNWCLHEWISNGYIKMEPEVNMIFTIETIKLSCHKMWFFFVLYDIKLDIEMHMHICESSICISDKNTRIQNSEVCNLLHVSIVLNKWEVILYTQPKLWVWLNLLKLFRRESFDLVVA